MANELHTRARLVPKVNLNGSGVQSSSSGVGGPNLNGGDTSSSSATSVNTNQDPATGISSRRIRNPQQENKENNIRNRIKSW